MQKKLQVKLLDISKSIFNQKISSELVKIILDENINGLILVGKAGNTARLEKLIAQIDIESGTGQRVQILELKNSDAKAVAVSLNNIVSKQVYTDPSMKPNISVSEEINADYCHRRTKQY
ncbi:MAG: hypothetical protein Q9M40_02330 [Sulfurimonas sp.]|nr:hypothetical protein [Sulfurimonas sp.]